MSNNTNLLKGLSSQELIALSKEAVQLAEQLKASQPSYELAILNGVRDVSYDTTANGYISSYTGEAIIKLEDGSIWKATGKRSTGDAWYAYNGRIEFTKIDGTITLRSAEDGYRGDLSCLTIVSPKCICTTIEDNHGQGDILEVRRTEDNLLMGLLTQHYGNNGQGKLAAENFAAANGIIAIWEDQR